MKEKTIERTNEFLKMYKRTNKWTKERKKEGTNAGEWKKQELIHKRKNEQINKRKKERTIKSAILLLWKKEKTTNTPIQCRWMDIMYGQWIDTGICTLYTLLYIL